MQQIVTPGSSLTITCILKLWNASLAVRSGYVMTSELKCACWADGENHNDELSGDDSFMYGWAEGENHNDELSGDDSFMYGWAEGENRIDELSGDDSFMYGWAEGENRIDKLSGDDSFMFSWAEGENNNIDELSEDDSCMYDTHDTYNQRIEWFWGCLKKKSGWMYFGTWQVTQESPESFIPFLNQTFTRFYVFFFNLACFHAIVCSIISEVLNLYYYVFFFNSIYMIIGWAMFLNLSD